MEDFSLYISLKEYFNQKPWYEWDHRFKFRNSSTLNNWREEHQDKIQYYEFIQFIFFEQWKKIKVYANKKGIKIFGDIPIFVAYDSSDVWAHPDYFYLDKKGDLEYVAGVPPDEFSETGQRWGNPLYQWEVLEEQDFDWWIQRIKFSFKLIDLLRIDHFRGFEAYWRIPAEESTAVIGKWIPGPGYKFFKTLKEKLGPLPIIAEDLGVITKEVEDLLEKTGYPGMRVLQFAFGNKKSDERVSKYLPHNYIPKTVVYTGTHDNNTTKGWFDSLPKKIQKWVLNYTGTERDNLVYNLIRLAISSVSRICIIPLQDVLKLGEEARMNLPGTMEGNWEWRFTWDLFNDEDIAKFKNFCQIYERDSINNVKN
ncbi:MAG: 4-alpha-glucanotransferase [Candidatus Lokiarchaeota archaeon]